MNPYKEEKKELNAVEYFSLLDKWCNRYTHVMNHIQKRMLNEYDYRVGIAPFSQVEINRILINK